MTVEEIFEGRSADQTIALLKEKSVVVPPWKGTRGLEREYESDFHPVMDKGRYPDVVTETGIQQVTRVPLDFQKLAVSRMTSLMTGIPVKRIYTARTDRQKELAEYMESIFERVKIDSVNQERCDMLYASCEVVTLWYAVEEDNSLYGFDSPLKLRCRNFSPMRGDGLYPLFDEYGDLIALSVGYTRKVGKNRFSYFDTYTADRHVFWSTQSGEWREERSEGITLGKIPGVYLFRPTPIWEKTSPIVYEMEWELSRNGNYLRDNSKPLFCVFADEAIRYGDEKDSNHEFRAVTQFPAGGNAQYVTWPQAVDSLKFSIDTQRSLFFTILQLPDWSYEKMSQVAMSGESRKQLFLDAQMKAKRESGILVDAFSREVNVVKAFLKVMLDEADSKELDALAVEIQITPFSITDEKDVIDNLMAANGNLPVMSQRESIEQLGWSKDVDETLREIAEQRTEDLFA